MTKAGCGNFVGNWRTNEMEAWDADYCDMEVPAYLTIRKDLTGEFQFGLVQAQLDGKIESVEASSRLAFTWSGFDENDPVNGRGWFNATGDQAEGRIPWPPRGANPKRILSPRRIASCATKPISMPG